MAPVAVRRTQHRMLPDARRVIAKPFLDDVAMAGETSRAGLLIRRILDIPEPHVQVLLDEVLATFAHRHRAFDEILERHFAMVAFRLDPAIEISRARRLLIGAYFTNEYSVESAAFFNPSIVLAPDQRGLAAGVRRFVMSVRAVGEGHISSIEFRTGTIDARSTLTFDPVGPHLVTGHRSDPSHYDKVAFHSKLAELEVDNELARDILARVPALFTLAELEASLAVLKALTSDALQYETEKIIRVLAASNYVTSFPPESSLSERNIFPAGPHETHGMEDARFVRFEEPDGAVRYYATYTAYDGYQILPQLIWTDDFLSFSISTLNGLAAQNKGMALFPRKVGGKYVMLSRKDRENLHLSISDDVRYWNDVTELHEPSKPWELRHIGNCGSPLETKAGWLVITHGVGPMRRYALSAILLDLDDPRRVLGSLAEPLLLPDETEREGYVPNVVYTCGGMINGDDLVLPYGFSDFGVAIALVSLPELLAALTAK